MGQEETRDGKGGRRGGGERVVRESTLAEFQQLFAARLAVLRSAMSVWAQEVREKEQGAAELMAEAAKVAKAAVSPTSTSGEKGQGGGQGGGGGGGGREREIEWRVRAERAAAGQRAAREEVEKAEERAQRYRRERDEVGASVLLLYSILFYFGRFSRVTA